MEVDEMPDENAWYATIVKPFIKPSPKLAIQMKKKELDRRIWMLDCCIKRYERQRLRSVAKLKQAVKNRATANRLDQIGKELANYESLQNECGNSIIIYQEGIQTLERLHQMIMTTEDFKDINTQLTTVNRRLNLNKTVSMTRSYERNMDTLEQKDVMMRELIVDRHEYTEESRSRANEYIQKAREEAGLVVEGSMPSSSKAGPSSEASGSSSSSQSAMSDEDRKLFERVMGL